MDILNAAPIHNTALLKKAILFNHLAGMHHLSLGSLELGGNASPPHLVH